MDFFTALFIFLSGALSHAFLEKLLGINTRVKVYRITLISCLGIMKYAGSAATEFLSATLEDKSEKQYIKVAVQHWQNLALLSLKNAMPTEIWSSMGVKDWNDVERLIKKLENTRGEI